MWYIYIYSFNSCKIPQSGKFNESKVPQMILLHNKGWKSILWASVHKNLLSFLCSLKTFFPNTRPLVCQHYAFQSPITQNPRTSGTSHLRRLSFPAHLLHVFVGQSKSKTQGPLAEQGLFRKITGKVTICSFCGPLRFAANVWGVEPSGLVLLSVCKGFMLCFGKCIFHPLHWMSIFSLLGLLILM